MSEESYPTDVSERESAVHHRGLFDGDGEKPSTRLVETVAELKGTEATDLQPLYSWVDGLIEDLYSSPPPPAAQAIVAFSYEGYRITLYQDGHAVFMDRSQT